jgi:hypothetical protein
MAIPPGGDGVSSVELAIPGCGDGVSSVEMAIPGSGDGVSSVEMAIPGSGDGVSSVEMAIPGVGNGVSSNRGPEHSDHQGGGPANAGVVGVRGLAPQLGRLDPRTIRRSDGSSIASLEVRTSTRSRKRLASSAPHIVADGR